MGISKVFNTLNNVSIEQTNSVCITQSLIIALHTKLNLTYFSFNNDGNCVDCKYRIISSILNQFSNFLTNFIKCLCARVCFYCSMSIFKHIMTLKQLFNHTIMLFTNMHCMWLFVFFLWIWSYRSLNNPKRVSDKQWCISFQSSDLKW